MPLSSLSEHPLWMVTGSPHTKHWQKLIDYEPKNSLVQAVYYKAIQNVYQITLARAIGQWEFDLAVYQATACHYNLLLHILLDYRTISDEKYPQIITWAVTHQNTTTTGLLLRHKPIEPWLRGELVYQASLHNHFEMVTLLLENEFIPIEARGASLKAAAHLNNVNIIHALLSHGPVLSSDWVEAVAMTDSSNNSPALLRLLKMPVDADSHSKAMTQALDRGDRKMAKIIRAKMICSVEKPDNAQ